MRDSKTQSLLSFMNVEGVGEIGVENEGSISQGVGHPADFLAFLLLG